MEAVTDFIFLGSMSTADGDSSYEIKRRLLLGRKAMTNLDTLKKQRHHLADKMVGQCHRSNQHEFDPTHGGSGRPEGLACSGPWGHEESVTT